MATSKERDMEQGKGHLAMSTPPIVSQQEWEAARQQLLVKEKALTRSRDALAAERRRMPWMAVEKKYEFDGPKGKVSLLDLFEGRPQLILYRAFFEPGVFGWPEHACRGCSLGADQVAHLAHLNARDTTLAYASRAPQADIARLKAVTRNTDIVILADEVYEHVVFDGARHHSMASHPELAERSVIVFSFGKSYHVTGWRVGYCLAPAALMNEIRKIHQFMMFAADTPMQYAFVDALAEEQSYLGLSEFYQKKRDLLAAGLAKSRFELLPSEGSFFMLARFRNFSDESDGDFVLRLIRDAGVATIPLSAFYTDGTDDGVIRLSFAKDEATLIEGARRLCSI